MSRELHTAWQGTLRRRGGDRAIVEAAGAGGATFRELDDGAAAWLARHAPDPAVLRGRTVVFALPNGIAWFELFLGLLKAGAVIAPLDAAEPPVAQRRIARALRAAFLWDGTSLAALPDAPRRRDAVSRLIKLTSGTTGAPRALRFSERQLLADATQVTATMGIKPRDLNYALIPAGHSYGLGNLTLPLIAQGVPLVCGTSPLPHAIAGDFARWRPTVFPGVPAMWRALAASDLALPGLRLAISAGAPLPPEVARDFATRFGQRLHNFYGSSETGGIAYDRNGKTTLAGGVGRALRGVTLALPSRFRLEVRSAAVFTQGNRRRHGKHGSWMMADRVTLDRSGDVTLLGRSGQTVKIAGRRVNLSEIAARIKGIEGVDEVWLAVSDETDPILGAAVVTRRTAAELRATLLADTPAWKIPKQWIMLTALPLTARGKADSPALRAMIFRTVPRP